MAPPIRLTSGCNHSPPGESQKQGKGIEFAGWACRTAPCSKSEGRPGPTGAARNRDRIGRKRGGWSVRFGRQFWHTENKQRAKSWAWGNKEHPSDGTTPSHREQALSFAAPHWPPHQCPPPGCDHGCLFYVLSCSLRRFTENSTESAVRHSPCSAGLSDFPTADHVAPQRTK